MWVCIYRCIYIFRLTYEIEWNMNLFVIGFSNDNVTFKAWYIFFNQPLSSSPFCFLKHSLNSCQSFRSSSIRYAEDSNLILWFWGKNSIKSLQGGAQKPVIYITMDTGCETPQEHPSIGSAIHRGKTHVVGYTIGSGQTSPSDRRIWRTHAWRNGTHAARVEVEPQISILQRPQHHFSATFLDVFGW